MYSYLQSVSIVLVGLLCTGAAILLVNRFWNAVDRKRYNDVMGWQFGVLGTTYAVILGFMLSSVWGNYTVASSDVADEATASLGVFRSAEGLHEPYSDDLRKLAIEYGRVVLDAEWPTMAGQRKPTQGEPVIASMWVVSHEAMKDAPAESNASISVRAAIRLLQDKRERRMEQYGSQLPIVMWSVLISGGVLVICSACLYGNEKLWLHCFHVLSLSLLILLMLTAVADLARPFEGGTSLDPATFREAFERMSTAVKPLSAP